MKHGKSEHHGSGGLSDVEQKLLSMIRAPNEDYLLTVIRREGRFTISQSYGVAAGGPRLGSDDTFDDAWKAAGLFGDECAASES